MKKIFGVLALQAFFYAAVAQQVTKEFSKLIVDEDFKLLQNNWVQESTADNLFLGSENGYDVWRKNKDAGFIILPEKAQEFSVFETVLEFDFANAKKKNQSGGIVLQAQPGGSGAVIVELNNKKQFRIRKARNNRFVNVTGTGEGWIKAKKFVNKDHNVLKVVTYDKIYDVYINGMYFQSFTEIELAHGKIGVYAGPESRILFSRLSVKSDDESTEIVPDKIDPENGSEVYTQAIIKLKESINKKDRKIAELEAEVRNINANRAVDSFVIREKEFAENRLAETVIEIEKLKTEAETLKLRVQELEFFKQQVKESENGDVVINLTNLTTRQRAQIDMLQKTNIELNKTIDKLKNDYSMLLTDNFNMQSQVMNLEKDKAALELLLHEKDSLIADLKIQLENAKKGENIDPNNSVPGEKEPKRKKKKKKEEDALFIE